MEIKILQEKLDSRLKELEHMRDQNSHLLVELSKFTGEVGYYTFVVLSAYVIYYRRTIPLQMNP